MSVFDYKRRPTTTTRIGTVEVGSDYPIRLQSMNNTLTTDIDGSVAQARRIADAGADIDRLTAQGVREANCMGEIRKKLREQGYDIPLVADIHFNPKAAFAAAEALEDLLRGAYRKGRRLFLVEGTARHEVASALLEGHVAAHHVDDVGAVKETRNEALRNHGMRREK